MSEREFTLIDGERVTRVAAGVDGSHVRIAPADLERAFGWTLKPQGLCKGDLCITLRERRGLVAEGGVDLAVFAQTTGLPLALDVAEGVAVLGESAAARGSRLASLEAPDFTLPDLAGQLHTLSSHRGKKVLLIAYASW
jgi:hypothetical protein